MFTKRAIYLSLLGTVCIAPLQANERTRLTFDNGGGATTPLNPTAQYVGVSGNFVAGAGYDLGRSNAIIGQFMWVGLLPNVFIRQPGGAPYGERQPITAECRLPE
jgi:hypothetical protein